MWLQRMDLQAELAQVVEKEKKKTRPKSIQKPACLPNLAAVV